MKLDRLKNETDETAKEAIYAAANIVADKIADNLNALPEETFRRLTKGEKFDGVPEDQKEDLIASFGIASIKTDKNSDWNTKIGFDGYGRRATKKYPKGLPNQMVARAIESGSSVRKKHPFVRPAVNATKKMALAEMKKVIDKKISEIMKGAK